jgi:hypothetical protein
MRKLSLSFIMFCSFLPSLVLAQNTLDSTFGRPAQMTDAQMNESKTFIHQGESQKTVDKGCQNNKDLKTCNINEVDSKGMVLRGDYGGILEQNIGRLYGMIFGAGSLIMGNGGPKVKVINKSAEGSDQLTRKNLTREQRKTLNQKDSSAVGDKGEGTAEKKSDYCVYPAMAYEAIAGWMQSSMQKDAENHNTQISDIQKQALENLKAGHLARRKTSHYQAGIYAATSSCYITRALASQGVAYWSKLSASAGLAVLFKLKANKHRDAAEAIDTIIKSLPKAGDYNPWTDTARFCKAEKSQELYPAQYEEACVLKKKNAAIPAMAMGCGVVKNGQMSFDKNCECKKTNTCFRTQLNGLNAGFSLGKNFMNLANKGYDLLGSGDFDKGEFDAYNAMAGSAISQMQKKITTDAISGPALSPEQKAIADSFSDILPAELTAVAATTQPVYPSGGGMTSTPSHSGLAKLPEDIKKKVEAVEMDVKYSKSGSGFGTAASDKEVGFTMPNFGQEPPKPESTEIISFAEQAISQADVSKTPETPLFDIISNRYRRSGWNKLIAEEKDK